MENFDQPLDTGIDTRNQDDQLQVTSVIRDCIREISTWSLVLCIIMIISVLASAISSLTGPNEGVSVFFSLLFTIGVYGMFAYYFYSIYAHFRNALNMESTEDLEEGVLFIRNKFSLYGIIIIIGMVIMVFGVIMALSMLQRLG